MPCRLQWMWTVQNHFICINAVIVLLTLFALINRNLFCFQHCVKHIIVREEKKYCFQSLHHVVAMLQSENMANNINTKNAKVCSLGELVANKARALRKHIIKKIKHSFPYDVMHNCCRVSSLVMACLITLHLFLFSIVYKI